LKREVNINSEVTVIHKILKYVRWCN